MSTYLRFVRSPVAGPRTADWPGPIRQGCNPCCSLEDMAMDRFDFSPLFRSTIGFDRLARLVDTATRVDSTALSYPPYNIEKTGEDAYRLTMAVAGFSQDELDITVHENTLIVTGKSEKEAEDGRYLHRGIARRAFER